MSVYRTIVVGTDGSVPARKALDHAGWIAAAADAKLVIVVAYEHHQAQTAADKSGAEDVLKGGAYKLHGDAPVYEVLHEAEGRAKAAGAKNVELHPVVGPPIEVLTHFADEVNADLLVVGNRGMTGVKGRLLGSVPASVSHRAKCDVLIVHTRD